MSLLLNIPVELRKLIIEHVLYTPLNPPVAPLSSDGAKYRDMNYKAWVSGVYYKQKNKPSSRVDYTLDISVEDDLKLYLTWLSVPCLTAHVSTLYAHVRLFGHIIEQHTARCQMGDGGRLGYHWSFYAALERFVRYGPVGEKKRKGEQAAAESSDHRRRDDTKDFQDRGIVIETLVLDFRSAELELFFPPEDVLYKHWQWWHCGRDMRNPSAGLEPLSSYKTRPQWLCQYLKMEIGALLEMSYHTAKYGQPLYEHIGTIRMLVDGQLVDEFDLATWLARLHFTDPGDTMGHLVREKRLSSFWEWKKETLSLRKERGLPVIWPSDDELRREGNN
ncbi:hypothetical protein ASPACDRAFT_1854132 [Aspergillus aculeatus ATCC 16872]|uniref:Uncharacterized protein n=1 Tax=Aspergillus aculeatus (strain ATCC 16872 / CBS 172.66 / WB 5094) TaxID=690307 RepID=A0A1L9X187_ASPA1|nr:uncharacterized protein ASPACDRAFT_1854132 [Aspergillus aculeatus ATCC 16872]OJK02126.1 hypothetical protein ASPACDRAFT_1854132 [Aspergillus aculeatus ATCC 16872]